MNRAFSTASKRLLNCLGAKPGHHVIVLTDHDNLIEFARAVKTTAANMGAIAHLVDVRGVDSGEAFKRVEAIAKKALAEQPDGVNIANLVYGRPLRLKVIKQLAAKHGAFVAHIPTDRLDVVLALLAADPDVLERKGNTLASKLTPAKKFRITTDEKHVLEIEWNRKQRALVTTVGKIRKNTGRYGNIGAEVFTAPITTNGTIVLHHVPLFPEITKPVRVEIKDNRVINLKQIPAPMRRALELSKEASQVGEFGIGLMKPVFLGNTLHDEKAGGTIHLGFGDSNSERGTGGDIRSEHHFDAIAKNPTVEMHDGKKWTTVIKNGKIL